MWQETFVTDKKGGIVDPDKAHYNGARAADDHHSPSSPKKLLNEQFPTVFKTG